MPVTSLVTKSPNLINISDVPGGPYTKKLFDQFMSALIKRGLVRRVPIRHIKIVFFNLLATIGKSTDEKSNQQLLLKYLEHFNRTNVDNQRRFVLNDKDFKKTSEMLDKIIFSSISDGYAGASSELPARPGFTTRKSPSWATLPPRLTTVTEKTTTTKRSANYPQSFDWQMPSLEGSMYEMTPKPHFSHYHTTSTTTFGGVASNTARPTTKSMLAELEYPTNHNRPKYQFMHEPNKHVKMKMTTTITTQTTTTTTKPAVLDEQTIPSQVLALWTLLKNNPDRLKTTSTTTEKPTMLVTSTVSPPQSLSAFGFSLQQNTNKQQQVFVQNTPVQITTTKRPMPGFYPQLVQAEEDSQNNNKQLPKLRPNFNNAGPPPVTTPIPTTPNPLSLLFGHNFGLLLDPFKEEEELLEEVITEKPLVTLQAPSNSNLSMTQWNQIINKLNFALQKLSTINKDDKKQPVSSSTSSAGNFDILENPQYINGQGQTLGPANNKTDVVINVYSYEDDYDNDDNTDESSINYKDYFQAILDTDSFSLDSVENDDDQRHPFLPISTTTTTVPPEEDYVYFYEDIIDQLFNVNIPIGDHKRILDLPGVGSKSPTPLSDFPSTPDYDYEYPDLGKYPALQLPIPLRPSVNNGRPILAPQFPKDLTKPASIGKRRQQLNDRVRGKTRLSAPGVIKETYGPPVDMMAIMEIPDFTSSGPVNIPSPLQLYGNIGRYVNKTSGGSPPPRQIDPDLTPVKSAVDPTFLAALIELIKQSEQEERQLPPEPAWPPVQGGGQWLRPNRFNFQLPSAGVLAKPHSLAQLESQGRRPQPVPIKWLEDRSPPRNRLPPYHRESLQPRRPHHQEIFKRDGGTSQLDQIGSSSSSSSSSSSTADMDQILRQFSSIETGSRFRSPPMMIPLEEDQENKDFLGEPPRTQKPAPTFTILTPQEIPHRTTNAVKMNNRDNLFEMVLRQQASPSRRFKRSSEDQLVLKPPPTWIKYFNDKDLQSVNQDIDIQLTPEDAVLEILQQRPDLQTTTPATTTTVRTTTRADTILSKPSAIQSEETSLAQPLFLLNTAGQFNLQTSLLGVANPLVSSSTSSSSSSISYNKLLIAAALSIVPTMVIAFPFIAPAFGGKKRRRRRK
jgi:hypothetical protein